MKPKDVWEYLERNQPDLRVAQHVSKKAPWHYATVNTRDYRRTYNHRAVMQNEVVLDLDDESKDKNSQGYLYMDARGREMKLKFSVWQTGGKGYHLHYIFEGLEKVHDIRLMKGLLAEHILGPLETVLKWDRQLLGKHLVRMEGGMHERYPGQYRYKTLWEDCGHLQPNKIPNSVWKKYRQEVIKSALYRLRRRHEVPSGRHTPTCLKHILSPKYREHKDGGKRAIFIIASFFRKVPDDELITLLKDYNKYNLREPLNPFQLKQLFDSVRNNKGRFVGCRYRHALLREVGACEVADQCEKQREAKDKEVTLHEKKS